MHERVRACVRSRVACAFSAWPRACVRVRVCGVRVSCVAAWVRMRVLCVACAARFAGLAEAAEIFAAEAAAMPGVVAQTYGLLPEDAAAWCVLARCQCPHSFLLPPPPCHARTHSLACGVRASFVVGVAVMYRHISS